MLCTKSSLIALQIAIENQDWESATRHCARAMALPNDMISGLFAETAVVSGYPVPEARIPALPYYSPLQRAIFLRRRPFKQQGSIC